MKPEQRMLCWREFREGLKQKDDIIAISETAELWSTAPISSQYLSPDLPNEWPGPWDLLYQNVYDDLSITLGITYTLYLASERFFKPRIKILVNKNTHETFNTVWFGNIVANYEYGVVVDAASIPSNLTVRYEYTSDNLNLQQYI